MSIRNFNNKQPLVTQLDPNFKGPPIANTIVEKLNDLINIPKDKIYNHQLVWVEEEETFYFKFDGDGSVITHWKKYISSLNIKPWESNKQYKINDIVHLSNIIYSAKKNVKSIKSPNEDSDNWDIITGKQKFGIKIFRNESKVLITINDEIPLSSKLPKFTIYIGEFVTDSSGILTNNDGSLKLRNIEIIEAEIKRLTEDNNQEWEISFFENFDTPKKLTGYIIFE